MALDPALSEALRSATRDAGQSDAVASRLLAWLTQMSDSELSRDAMANFYQEVLKTLKMGDAQDAD